MPFPLHQQHRRANSDLARQLACVRAFVQQHRDAQAASASVVELAPPPTAGLERPMRTFFDDAEMSARKSWARRLKGDAGIMVSSSLNRIAELGSRRCIAQVPDAGALDGLDRDFPHCQEATGLIRRYVALARRTVDGALKVPNLLLSGPPGVGKTAYVTALARALGLRFVSIDVPMLSADFSMSGLDPSYSSAKPGLVFDALDGACIAPIVMLDEIDKLPRTGDAALGCLHALLEPPTAARFTDAAIGLPVDASHIAWMATCNDADLVAPALRSRFQEVAIPAPSPAQMPAVIDSVHRQLRARSAWSASFRPNQDEADIGALRTLTPRELRLGLEQAYAQAAEAERDHLMPEDIPRAQPTTRRSIGFST